MLPVPASHWSSDLAVPVEEVVEVLHQVLRSKATQLPVIDPLDPSYTCVPGTFFDEQEGRCRSCPPGSYSSAALRSCTLCPPGRFTPFFGSTYCGTCPPNTYSNGAGAAECLSCPEGKVSALLGADSVASCKEAENQIMHSYGQSYFSYGYSSITSYSSYGQGQYFWNSNLQHTPTDSSSDNRNILWIVAGAVVGLLVIAIVVDVVVVLVRRKRTSRNADIHDPTATELESLLA